MSDHNNAIWLDELRAVLPVLLDVDEAAEAIRRSPDRVRRLIHDGKLGAVRACARGPFLIPREEILGLLLRNQASTGK